MTPSWNDTEADEHVVALTAVLVVSASVTWWRRYRRHPAALTWAGGAIAAGALALLLPTLLAGTPAHWILGYELIVLAVYGLCWYLAERSFRSTASEPIATD
ncbi:MAG: hypothetical protein ACT4RN_01610 [Pseudonocardia sp.]